MSNPQVAAKPQTRAGALTGQLSHMQLGTLTTSLSLPAAGGNMPVPPVPMQKQRHVQPVQRQREEWLRGDQRLTTMPRSAFSFSSTVLSSTRFINWSKPRSTPVTWRLAFSLTAIGGRGRRPGQGGTGQHCAKTFTVATRARTIHERNDAQNNERNAV